MLPPRAAPGPGRPCTTIPARRRAPTAGRAIPSWQPGWAGLPAPGGPLPAARRQRRCLAGRRRRRCGALPLPPPPAGPPRPTPAQSAWLGGAGTWHGEPAGWWAGQAGWLQARGCRPAAPAQSRVAPPNSSDTTSEGKGLPGWRALGRPSVSPGKAPDAAVAASRCQRQGRRAAASWVPGAG